EHVRAPRGADLPVRPPQADGHRGVLAQDPAVLAGDPDLGRAVGARVFAVLPGPPAAAGLGHLVPEHLAVEAEELLVVLFPRPVGIADRAPAPGPLHGSPRRHHAAVVGPSGRPVDAAATGLARAHRGAGRGARAAGAAAPHDAGGPRRPRGRPRLGRAAGGGARPALAEALRGPRAPFPRRPVGPADP